MLLAESPTCRTSVGLVISTFVHMPPAESVSATCRRRASSTRPRIPSTSRAPSRAHDREHGLRGRLPVARWPQLARLAGCSLRDPPERHRRSDDLPHVRRTCRLVVQLTCHRLLSWPTQHNKRTSTGSQLTPPAAVQIAKGAALRQAFCTTRGVFLLETLPFDVVHLIPIAGVRIRRLDPARSLLGRGGADRRALALPR